MWTYFKNYKYTNTCHGTTVEAQPSAGMLKVFIEQLHSQLSWNQLCSKVTHCWEREKKTSWAVYRIRIQQVTHSLLAPRLPPTAGGRNASRCLILTLKQANNGARSSCEVNLLHWDQFKRSSSSIEPHWSSKRVRFLRTAQHQMMNTWPLWQDHHFWPLAMVSAKGENRCCVWQRVYGQTRHMHVAQNSGNQK